MFARGPGPFGIVSAYHPYFAEMDELLRPGGLFVSDNMLWQGRVLDNDAPDASTRGVLELTRALHARPDLDTAILPIRDGVSISALRR